MSVAEVKGEDALGTRYMRIDLGQGVHVWVLLDTDEALLDPGLGERVQLAAGLALEELRTNSVPRS